VLDPDAAGARGTANEDVLALLERARSSAGARYRAIVNVADVDTARSLAALLESSPGSEIRHRIMRAATRFVLFDEREAILSVVSSDAGGPAGGLTVHTTNASTVQSLRAQFEQAWSGAMSLGRRLEELEVFPHIQPRDIGLGRLFQDVRDPVFVADASGRILLWNEAATAAFGHEVHEALTLRVPDILPDALGLVRDVAAGGTVESIEVTAIRKDGEPFAVDLALRPARDASNGVTYVLAIARLQGPQGKRLEVLDAEPLPKRRS
jgi:PAS domain S-box-containing protein